MAKLRWTAGAVLALGVMGAAVAAAAPAQAGPSGPPAVPIAANATYIAAGSTSPLSPSDIGYLNGITCPTATLCYAVGGTPPNTLTTGTAALVLTLRRPPGGDWRVTAASSDWSNLASLDSISCSDATHCAASGSASDGFPAVEETADGNGADWAEVPEPTSATKMALASVSCVDRSCMALGSAEIGHGKREHFVDQLWVTSTKVATTFNGDPAWVTTRTPSVGVELEAVDCTAPGSCWVVGATGAWRTTDDGRQWSFVDLPGRPTNCAGLCAQSWDLLDTVQMFSTGHGYLAGGSQCGAGQTFHCPGVVLSTADGGAHWEMSAPANMPFINRLACAPPDGNPCMGTAQEYSGYTSAHSVAYQVASDEVASGDGRSWTVGPWLDSTDLWAVACPAGGGSCLVTGAPLSGAGKGLGAVYLAQAGTGPGATSRTSSISGTLPTPRQSLGNIGSDVAGAAMALGLALFITFPANLFNSTFEENYADIVAWWSKWDDLVLPPEVRRRLKAAYGKAKSWALGKLRLSGRSAEKTQERENTDFVVVLLLGALLGTMLDPAFGANLRTVISYIAISIAMLAGVVISGLVTSGYHRASRHGKVPYKLEALPAGLAVAAACVAISRVSGFTPGYLYGVICGVQFSRPLAKHEEGHLVALSSAFKVALALVAWAAWDAVTDHATKQSGFIGTVLLDDFLASLFVSQLVGTLISLFPLRFLPGHKLQTWHRGVWAATFGLTLFVLLQVLLRPHGGSSAHGQAPVVTTVALFALFGLGSLLFREHFARKHRRRQALAGGIGPEEEALPALAPEGAGDGAV